MSAAGELLMTLENLDIRLSVVDGNLRCNAPKGAITDDLRNAISRHKQELLAALAATEKNAAPADMVQPARPPLSASQERIWLLSQIDPAGHKTGNVQFAFQIHGQLDADALEKALSAIVGRHQVLATGCSTVNFSPVQEVHTAQAFNLPVADLTSLAEEEQAAQVDQAVQRCLLHDFKLDETPLLRAELLVTGRDSHVFLLVSHLFVFDGWSTAILLKELAALYEAFGAGRCDPLPPLSMQYGDFSRWQNQWFSRPEARRQKDYWIGQLRGAQLASIRYARGKLAADEDTRVAESTFVVPGFLADMLRNLARETGVTLYNVLFGAFQAWLHGYTGQSSIATGTIVSNRRLRETEAMIGSFANPILIKSSLVPGMSFRDLLLQTRQTLLEAFSHQDMPFEKFLAELEPQLRASPVFRTMFVLHQHRAIESAGFSLAGVQIEKAPLTKPHSKYDFELVMVDHSDSLSGTFFYKPEALSRCQAEDIKSNFLKALKIWAADPDGEIVPSGSGSAFSTSQASGSAAAPPVREPQRPRTETEARVLSLWRRLLCADSAGLLDGFAELGGHSLLAMALVAQVQDEFGIRMPLAELSRFPTAAEIAEMIDGVKTPAAG